MSENQGVNFRAIDIGVIVTVLLSIIGATLFIGILRGEINQIKSSTNLEEVKKVLAEEKKLAISAVKGEALSGGLPVGTVIASFLSPEKFSLVANRKPYTSVDYLEFSWVLAAGQTDIPPECEFVKAFGQRTIPDLRGMFIRGINFNRADQYRDPDGERQPGHVQGHATVKHAHGYTDHFKFGNASKRGGNNHEVRNQEITEHKVTNVQDGGKEETRPNNSAVYYYIKIN